MLAFIYIHAMHFGKLASLLEVVAAAEAEALTAISLDPDEPSALAALALAAFGKGDHDAAVDHADRAISIDPNHAGAFLAKASSLVYAGRTSEAREACMVALRLSPRDPFGATVRLVLTVSHYLEGNYADALAVARSTTRDYPDFPQTYRYVAASLGQLGGRTNEARAALRRAMTISPEAFRFHVVSRPPWFRREDHEHMLDGLRKAGWQG
jgi:adenylate cyclase